MEKRPLDGIVSALVSFFFHQSAPFVLYNTIGGQDDNRRIFRACQKCPDTAYVTTVVKLGVEGATFVNLFEFGVPLI